MQLKVCFCILHYLSFKTTCECIDSILQLEDMESCKIVVLDNGSKNDSFEKLQNRYGSNKYIDLHQIENGLGFSEGNNYMYRIAKSMHPKYIIELNNDITIEQKDFIKRLDKINESGKYYVIGPDIYDRNVHVHQSPIVKKLPSIENLDLTMQRKREKLSFCSGGGRTAVKSWLHSIFHRIMPESVIKKFRQVKRKIGLKVTDEQTYRLSVENPVFCGACLIFTDAFIENEIVMFEPDTGFYLEELCLSLKCELKHYPTLYTPDIQVKHHSQTATKLVVNKAKDRERFALEKTLYAYDVYRKYYFDMIAIYGDRT